MSGNDWGLALMTLVISSIMYFVPFETYEPDEPLRRGGMLIAATGGGSMSAVLLLRFRDQMGSPIGPLVAMLIVLTISLVSRRREGSRLVTSGAVWVSGLTCLVLSGILVLGA